MSNRTIRIDRIATNKPGKFIDVEVRYDKGGANYFSGGTTSRGYVAAARPVTVREDGGVSFMMFSGVKHTVEAAARFSQKQLERVANEQQGGTLIKNLVAIVCRDEDLTIPTPTDNCYATEEEAAEGIAVLTTG